MLFSPLFSSLFLAKNFEPVRATFLHWFGQGALGLIGSLDFGCKDLRFWIDLRERSSGA